jgi:hypothetical protein
MNKSSVSGLSAITLIFITMGLFSFLKKPGAAPQEISGPYKDPAVNVIYQLLFCDDLQLYKEKTQQPYRYPFDILFSDASSVTDLQKVIDDAASEPRVKILACNRQLASGHKPAKKELLAVIVEVGLDGGLDVLASFSNGTARYINQTGKVLVWETTTDYRANELTRDLFIKSEAIINQIGPWDKPRRPHPPKGNARMSFLVSDGLYFGEAPINVLFNDPKASAALNTATQLMQYLTQQSLQQKQ